MQRKEHILSNYYQKGKKKELGMRYQSFAISTFSPVSHAQAECGMNCYETGSKHMKG